MSSDIRYGTVVWFNEGFGFISQGEDKPDIFVHYSDILAEGYRVLYQGQRVSFEIGKNIKGIDKAINVTVLKE